MNTKDDLLATLSEHRIVDESQLTRLQSAGDKDPEWLLDALQQNGWLTSFQTDKIRQGRASELILNDAYLLLDVLGEGGMGTVFRAKHLGLNQIRAIKTIRPDYAGSKAALQRFQREMRLAAQLDHPNVIRVFDSGESNGMHYFVMEMVQGTDLGDLVARQGRLPIAQAVDYVRQAALGLQHAHEQGMIHRDIKPSNLLLTDQGVVKILDMGLARATDAQSESLVTQTGQLMGTPDFISPEQTVNAKAVDIRADVYSLGCSLYQLLTGKVPFPGGSIPAKLLRHCKKQAAPVEKLRPEVPAGLVQVLKRMMAKNPERRQQTPQDVADDLQPFCDVSTEANGGSKEISKTDLSTPTLGESSPPKSDPPIASTLRTLPASQAKSVGSIPAGVPEPIPPTPEIVSSESVQSASTMPLRPEKDGGHSLLLRVGMLVSSLLVLVLVVYLIASSGSSREEPGKPLAGMNQKKPEQKPSKHLKPDQKNPEQKPSKHMKPEITNSIGMKLRLIRAGTFTMGAPVSEDDRREDEHQHEVEITKPFYVGIYEVTQREFKELLGRSPSYFNKDNQGGPDHPVEHVSWYDCVEFCNALSEKENLKPCYELSNVERENGSIKSAVVKILPNGTGYRLPTESEWEYACRGGSAKYQVFAYGNTLSSKQANFVGDSPDGGAAKGESLKRTTKVGSYPPNGFGLFDMHGNVWEWCQDWYHKDYYQNSPKQDPQGAKGEPSSRRSLRGGTYHESGKYCRSADRYWDFPSQHSNLYGFRIVRPCVIAP